MTAKKPEIVTVIQSKPWYTSRAVWTNIAMFSAALIPIISSQAGDVIGTTMALQVATVLGLFNAVLQVAIRIFLTDSAIKQTTP